MDALKVLVHVALILRVRLDQLGVPQLVLEGLNSVVLPVALLVLHSEPLNLICDAIPIFFPLYLPRVSRIAGIKILEFFVMPRWSLFKNLILKVLLV